jgi:hypothetical protein
MKIDANFALMLLRLVLCNEKLLSWLKAEAAKTDTPVDDTAVKVLEFVLCGEDKE